MAFLPLLKGLTFGVVGFLVGSSLAAGIRSLMDMEAWSTEPVIALGYVFGLGRRGRFIEGSNWGVEGAVKYWRFVDVAWVFIYPTLYLVN